MTPPDMTPRPASRRRVRLTASALDDMRDVTRRLLGDTQDGRDPDADDVATLARYVLVLADEVDTLVWRATAATMALDGRLRPRHVFLGTGGEHA